MTEVFLCAARRTPVGRYGGALARLRPDDMAAAVVDGLLDLHPGLGVEGAVGWILGCANQAGEDNRNVARMAVLLSRLGRGRAGADRQPPLRLGPRRGHRGRAGHPRRRGRGESRAASRA
jgi:acetyl-CoA acetyltransferase